MSELKCCPFCGGEAKYMEIKDFFISRFVTCTKCGIETPRNCLNRKDAIKQWNRRTPMDNIVENIVTSLESEKSVFLGTRIEQTDTILIDDAINIVKQEINNGLE